jgi:hypothetical protein
MFEKRLATYRVFGYSDLQTTPEDLKPATYGSPVKAQSSASLLLRAANARMSGNSRAAQGASGAMS